MPASLSTHPWHDAPHNRHSCPHHVPDLVQHEGVATHLQADAGDTPCITHIGDMVEDASSQYRTKKHGALGLCCAYDCVQ